MTERFFCFSRNPPLQCLTKSFGRIEIDRETLSIKRKFVGLMNVKGFQIWVGFASGGFRARLAGETAF
jgi:hypothetical protein